MFDRIIIKILLFADAHLGHGPGKSYILRSLTDFKDELSKCFKIAR